MLSVRPRAAQVLVQAAVAAQAQELALAQVQELVLVPAAPHQEAAAVLAQVLVQAAVVAQVQEQAQVQAAVAAQAQEPAQEQVLVQEQEVAQVLAPTRHRHHLHMACTVYAVTTIGGIATT